MHEILPSMIQKGRVKVYAAHDLSWVLLDQKNLICSPTRNLFARMVASLGRATMGLGETCYGVWGLAVGAGAAEWANSSPLTPPPAPADTNVLHNVVKRKQLMPGGVRFLNQDDSTSDAPTRWVEFQTLINATTDNIDVPLMEMGLIGGGTRSARNGAGTDMTSAPFWDPTHNDPDSVVLLNYTTFGSLTLPKGVDFIFSWTLEF